MFWPSVVNLAFGIEHEDVNPLHAKEAVGHGTARVSAGGHQHVHCGSLWLGCSLARNEIPQQARHETCTHILESKRGAVEKLQTIDAFGHAHQWNREGERVADYRAKHVGRHVLAKEGVCHAISYLVERHFRHAVEELCGQSLDALGHVESAVFGQSPDNCLLQRCLLRLMVGAVVFHFVCY